MNVSQPRQPLCSTALIPYTLIKLTLPFFVFRIKTGKNFLNQFKKKLATKTATAKLLQLRAVTSDYWRVSPAGTGFF